MGKATPRIPMTRSNTMPTTQLRIGPHDIGRKMTLDEFREAEEQPGYLYELARGVLDVVEVPRDEHGRVIHRLHRLLILHDLHTPGPIAWIGHGSDIRLLITETESDRHPDLAVVFQGAPVNSRGRELPGLVIEVVSPGARAQRRDHEEKREEYLLLEIPEYWIVDPEKRQVTVFVRDTANARWSARVFQGDDRIESSLLPGFAGKVADLWEGHA